MTEINLSGGEKLERRLEAIAAKIARPFTLRVGFLEGATYPDGTPVATIAALQNFGSPGGKIPARPFFTKMIEEKSGNWGEALANRLVALDWDLDKALEQMGNGIAGQLRTAIVEMNEPANSPVTALLKSRFPDGVYEASDVWEAYADVAAGESAPGSKPLVWSGNMLNSVDYEVTDGADG